MSKDSLHLSLCSHGQAFALSFRRSFQVYSVDPPQLKFEKAFDDLRLSLIATASDGAFVAFTATAVDNSHPKIVIWNTVYGDMHAQVDLTDTVTSLLLSSRLLCVAHASSLRLFDIERRALAFECATPANPKGIADVSAGSETARIAVPGDKPGVVCVRVIGAADCVSFRAAKHRLSLVRFSPDGSLLATASEKGTLIRVFEADSGAPRSVSRRGSLKSTILALCFAPNNRRLVAVSSNGTVHLFAVDAESLARQDAPRAISKVKVGRARDVRAVFAGDQEVVVAGSDGGVCTIRCGEGGFCDSVAKNVFAR
jgi:WD40 repeat protein